MRLGVSDVLGGGGFVDWTAMLTGCLGLLNHDWTAWRSQAVIDEYVKPFVAATLG